MNFAKESATFSFVTLSHDRPTSYYADSVEELTSSSCRENPHFKQGLLLETLEKGVTYPILHRGSVENYLHEEFENGITKTGRTTIPGCQFAVEKGRYQEVESIRADLFGRPLDDLLSLAQGDLLRPNWGRFFIILGFKQLPTRMKTKVLENHWKDWSGARYLYLNLPDDFGLFRVTFYKRIAPDDFGLFLYLVVAECIHVTPTDETPLLDFVRRMRADKMPFYLALYRESDASEKASHHFGSVARHANGWPSSGGSVGRSGSPDSFSSEDVTIDSPSSVAASPVFNSSRVTFRSDVSSYF